MSEETPTQYQAIYSDQGRMMNRIPQIDDGMLAQLLAYQQYMDTKINNKLRAALGNYDKNKFYIPLPLNGDFDVIDIQQMVVQLAMDMEVCMAADDCVISKFRSDTAENDQKMMDAEQRLFDIIYHKYGGGISTDIDFTTKYLKSQKLLLDNGVPLELDDGSGVLLLDTNGGTPSVNPSDRVIFLPSYSYL